MMNTFVAIVSCWNHADLQQAVRETWLQNIPVPYKFFVGAPARNDCPNDVISLDVPDTRDELSSKLHAIFEWVYSRGFDFVFRVDDDEYVVVERLLRSNFYEHDFEGFRNGYYIHGSAYWLSRAALKIVLEDGRLQTAHTSAEDAVVSKILTEHGIAMTHNHCYHPEDDVDPLPGNGELSNDLIATHRCSPEDLRLIHGRFTGKLPSRRPDEPRRVKRQ